MTNETVLARLRDPFAPQDIEWRVQQAGEKNGKPWARVLAYVTNRAIMERLDETVGPENWRNEYHPGPAGGVVCGLSVRIARTDGTAEWVTKWDGAENSDVEPVKWFRWDPPALPEWAVPRPRPATVEQMERIEALLTRVADERVAGSVRKRLAGGLTDAAAEEAVRFLEARVGARVEEPGAEAAGPAAEASVPKRGARRAA